MNADIILLTDSELRNKIHWVINETICLDQFDKKDAHDEVNKMNRDQLLKEYAGWAKNGWFDKK